MSTLKTTENIVNCGFIILFSISLNNFPMPLRITVHHYYEWDFPDSSDGKESACNVGDLQCRVRKIHWRRDRLTTPVFLGFSCGSAGKESSCNYH